jgi:MoxR-like ATPase
VADKIDDILTSWSAGRNALLYGPPATGKTRLISELFKALETPPEAKKGIQLDPTDTDTPFTRPDQEIKIPQPIKVVWTTFHQSYGYEDFVMGLRPEITADGTRLQPWAGVFLDAALELNDPDSTYKSVVIFIDEVNRGNAARIFGEFMTFLDFDYRDGGTVPLPLPLRQLTYEDEQSEEIRRPNGKVTTIPKGFTFPKHVYIVSTMNSVDRAAVPIDSALARRFDRIEMRPNLDVLASPRSRPATSFSIV